MNFEMMVDVFKIFILAKVTVREPEFVDDPAAVARLAVLRSEGEGAVTLVWQLEGQTLHDLSPLNGTLVFNEVQIMNKL